MCCFYIVDREHIARYKGNNQSTIKAKFAHAHSNNRERQTDRQTDRDKERDRARERVGVCDSC